MIIFNSALTASDCCQVNKPYTRDPILIIARVQTLKLLTLLSCHKTQKQKYNTEYCFILCHAITLLNFKFILNNLHCKKRFNCSVIFFTHFPHIMSKNYNFTKFKTWSKHFTGKPLFFVLFLPQLADFFWSLYLKKKSNFQ